MTKKLSRAATPVRDVRLVRLANRLRQGVPVSRNELEDELEVSRATLTRDIAMLRDQLNMPIAFDSEAGGYLIADSNTRHGPHYELPGIWLSSYQAWGVLALVNVLSTIDPGVLRASLMPLRNLMKQIVGLGSERPPPVEDKLAIEIAYREECDTELFQLLSAALYKDKEARLAIKYSKIPTSRYSLQRFALTLDGWHIDAYHQRAREVLRIPVQLIETVEILERPAIRLEHDYEHADEDDTTSPAVNVWYDKHRARIPHTTIAL